MSTDQPLDVTTSDGKHRLYSAMYDDLPLIYIDGKPYSDAVNERQRPGLVSACAQLARDLAAARARIAELERP